MPFYEHVFLSRQDVSAQQVETMTDQFKGIIEAAGGTVSKIEYWGVKSLAYRIKKNRKAHFALLNISSPAAGVAEMERQMKINEDVIRFMTIKVEALEEGPSAMMQRREREERRDRERDGGRDREGGYGYEAPLEDLS
ncbi:MAG: 30S ribosomal protein S6 [Methylocystis sp.]|jgi:small subunit ribosomal protein S6|nr:30S ribosomal protein S6 [Methylocystis sp.]MCA3584772.1 30S ribosomal protein S6 [Methylocystis sp.]MCA3589826.1 30S ribosomal protein S6 [Methylocystis sp.]MCA3593209.1 30S ribosomal protein S6 [Methylocystis sp.]